MTDSRTISDSLNEGPRPDHSLGRIAGALERIAGALEAEPTAGQALQLLTAALLGSGGVPAEDPATAPGGGSARLGGVQVDLDGDGDVTISRTPPSGQ